MQRFPLCRPCLTFTAAACAALAASSPAAPDTIEITRKPFVIETTVQGIFAAADTAEIVLRPKEWSRLDVHSAVPHGARVSRGDVVLSLDTTQIDKALHDLRAEVQTAEIDAAAAQIEFHRAERSVALDLQAAERARRQADETLARFIEIDRPQGEKTARFNVLSQERALQYQREELRQLEKMYAADELIEETEEIILARQRHSVEQAEFALERSRIQSDETLSVSLPRTQAGLEEAAHRAAIEWQRAQAAIPSALDRQRLALEKSRLGLERARERLRLLEEDRGALTVKAPIDGIVYHGACTHGEWQDAQQAAARLRPGASAPPGTVLMTIVPPRPLHIIISLPEKDLAHLRPGMKAIARPAGFPRVALDAILRRIDAIPRSPGVFGAELTVAVPEQAGFLMPGMRAAVTVRAYEKKHAIAVPAAAVFSEPAANGAHFVHIVLEGRGVKRKVAIGRRTDEWIEIVEGLAEGDQILASPPGAR